jgi:hypothetical protein
VSSTERGESLFTPLGRCINAPSARSTGAYTSVDRPISAAERSRAKIRTLLLAGVRSAWLGIIEASLRLILPVYHPQRADNAGSSGEIHRHATRITHRHLPVDGRYRNRLTQLAELVSELALRHKITYELRWFEHLARTCGLPGCLR